MNDSPALEIIVSTAPRYLPHYTVVDHAAWEGDWELLDGVAVAMTPSPFGPHAERLSRLAAALWNGIDAAGCHATVLAEIDWIVANDTVVRPDLVVVCGPAPKRHVEQPPALRRARFRPGMCCQRLGPEGQADYCRG